MYIYNNTYILNIHLLYKFIINSHLYKTCNLKKFIESYRTESELTSLHPVK